MDELAALIEERRSGALEQAIFGTTDCNAMASQITRFLSDHISEPTSVLFYRPGAGLVIGMDCGTSGQIVLKLHRSSTDLDHLIAAQNVQHHLALQGFPAPMPSASPTRIGNGLATVEELIRGDAADGHSAVTRSHIASLLQQFIAVAATHPDHSALSKSLPSPTRPSGLWGEPHDLRFDFDATATGAEWIDEIATDAQQVLRSATKPAVIAHFDWRVQNLAIVHEQVVGVYDWDSVGASPEAVAVGQSSAHFSTDWTIGHSTLPSVEEMAAFVTDYERARGQSFDAEDRELIEAANLMVLAYSARCEHSDKVLHPHLAPAEGQSWAGLLAARTTQPIGQ